MAKNKDDIKYGAAQARLTEDDATMVAYKGGTPLEGGKIADSETVDLFSAAHNVENAKSQGSGGPDSAEPQLNRDQNEADQGGAGTHPNFSSRRLPKTQ